MLSYISLIQREAEGMAVIKFNISRLTRYSKSTMCWGKKLKLVDLSIGSKVRNKEDWFA